MLFLCYIIIYLTNNNLIYYFTQFFEKIQKPVKQADYSIRYNDVNQLLIINVATPKCPENLAIFSESKEQIKLETPKFSVNYVAQIQFPKDLDVDIQSKRVKYNGHHFNISYKAKQITQQQQENKIITAEEKILQKQINSQTKLQIVSPEQREFNKTSGKKTKILSNIKQEHRRDNENTVLLKIAKQIVKQQQEKAFTKQENMQKKEKFILNQIEAKKKRQELKQARKQKAKEQVDKK